MRKLRPLLLFAVAALSLGASSYAAAGGNGNGNNGNHGRPSVVPPPNSNGHCGHRGGTPPCNNK